MASGATAVNWGDPRLPERFWANTSPCPITGCWHWTGANKGSRPVFCVKRSKSVDARRLIWTSVFGEIMDGYVLSRCDNTCVNPAHATASTVLVGGAPHRTCKACNSVRPEGEFWSLKGRRVSSCKQCQTEYTRSWRTKNPERHAEQKRRRTATIRVAREVVLGTARNCEICGALFTSNKRPHCAYFDHNHGTGAPRGWLCQRCNAGIGALGDNPRLIRAAAEYLENHGFAASRPVIK